MPAKIAIICPVYNEEEVLEKSMGILDSLLLKLSSKDKVSKDSYIVLVDDGSSDNSWKKINELKTQYKRIRGVRFSCNCGHQQALMAGMVSVKNKVDAAITIDVDLQDDINAIEKMVDKFNQGNDVVYGVKTKRDADGFFKRITAQAFYSFQHFMGIKIVYNHADFRLVSNKVIVALSHCNEQNLYLRGLIPTFGFKSDTVDDVISDRLAGQSKYSPKKMFKLASDGILSFSSRPLVLISWLGLIFLIVALINAIDVIVAIINNTATPGWSQLMLSVWFVGGVVLICLGLVGLYLGRLYNEVKARPNYVISEVLE